MNKNILFIGIDLHKESIEIAIAEGSNQEAWRYGKIGGARDEIVSSDPTYFRLFELKIYY